MISKRSPTRLEFPFGLPAVLVEPALVVCGHGEVYQLIQEPTRPTPASPRPWGSDYAGSITRPVQDAPEPPAGSTLPAKLVVFAPGAFGHPGTGQASGFSPGASGHPGRGQACDFALGAF